MTAPGSKSRWKIEGPPCYAERGGRGRIAHSAHHRGRLTAYLRLPGRSLYSTYGPTADTGGLFQQAAPVIYDYQSVESLIAAARDGNIEPPSLPGPGTAPPTERPGRG